MLSRPCARDVKKVSLRHVNLFQFRFLADVLHPGLERYPSSSHAITTTALNSRPLARCMVQQGISPGTGSMRLSKTEGAAPAASTARLARLLNRIHPGQKTPNSFGSPISFNTDSLLSFGTPSPLAYIGLSWISNSSQLAAFNAPSKLPTTPTALQVASRHHQRARVRQSPYAIGPCKSSF